MLEQTREDTWVMNEDTPGNQVEWVDKNRKIYNSWNAGENPQQIQPLVPK